MSKFEIYKDKKGETRFRFRARNGEVMFTSEAYKAKASAVKAIESLRKNVAEAVIEEIAPADKKAPAKAAAKAPARAKSSGKSEAAAKPSEKVNTKTAKAKAKATA